MPWHGAAACGDTRRVATTIAATVTIAPRPIAIRRRVARSGSTASAASSSSIDANRLARIDRDRAQRDIADSRGHGRGHGGRRRVLRRHELLRVRPLAGERLVQHDAERELIAARVGAVAVEQLRCHVRGRADHAVDDRQIASRSARADRCSPGGGIVSPRRVAREPEVHHADAAVLADDHVLGLEVAMDELRVVRGGEPCACGEHDVARPRATSGAGLSHARSVMPSTSSIATNT